MWRSLFIFILFIAWVLAVIGKLFFWQVISYSELAAAAEAQHFVSLTLPAVRGDILASDGSILVTNQPAYLVYAEPNKIKDKDQFINLLAPILEIPEASLSSQIKNDKLLWALLKKRVDEETVDKIKNLQITGIGFEKEGKRYYPEASMSAHLLGFVGLDSNGLDKGYFGLEGFYDKELKGRDGFLRQEKDPYGAPIIIGNGERIEPENGRSLKLFIDKTVQMIVEEKLKKGIERFGAKGGQVVVMEPESGAILAMAAFPAYDPVNFAKFNPAFYKNPVIANTYEPGSTFKALIMAAALNEEVVKPQTKVEENGPVNIGGFSIKTWNNQYHGEITMTQVLQYSSNVGMVAVANKLGKEKMLEYIKKFGFGSLTGIDLQEEITPSLRPDDQWKEIDLATVSFGQGIAVTPIQMIRAFAALANGGKLIEPRMVAEIIDNNGKVIKTKPKIVRRVIKETTAKMVTEMLVASVEGGEAHYKLPKGFRIAGKTGTAQIPVKGHYDEEKTIASFVGYAPADQPKFVMLVTLVEPTSSPWGSETAAPLFMEITSELLNYYKIFPAP